MSRHLTTDELVDRLYDVGTNDHVEQCQECSDRYRQFIDRKTMAAEPASASQEFLAAQRRTIYARMGQRPQQGLKWVPALAAAACLVTAGLFVYHPAQVSKSEVSDAQLFSDVYSMEQSMEPVAASPIHALFEQDSQ